MNDKGTQMTPKKQAHYFSHDYNARNDERILELRSEFGWEGYGIFFAIVELMAENSGHLNYSKPALIAMSLQVDVEKVKKLLSKCIEVGLFFEQEGLLRSKRLDAHFDLRQSLSEYGRIGGQYKPPSSPPQAPLEPPSSHKESKESKVNENKENESKVKNIGSSAKKALPMKAPKIEDVIEYFQNIESTELEARKFHSYWEATNWIRAGGVRIKDWRHAARNWKLKSDDFKQNQNGQPTTKSKSQQRFDRIASLGSEGHANG